MRFLFRPPAVEATDLLALPWDRPLEEWPDETVLTVPQRGISRHVVRFVATEGTVYALKEIDDRLARREYALLTDFAEEGLPAVEVLGVCVERPDEQPAILVTRYLEYSMSYRYLFSLGRGENSAGQLIDTIVELLVRLHLAGIFWGDCSLSNTLFRPDAGAMAAYLVDAETVERHAVLTPGQRAYDVDLATERVAAELMDLESGGLLPDGHRPDRPGRGPARPVRGAVGRGHPRRGGVLRRAGPADGRTAAPARRSRLRRRRGRADHLAGGVPPPGADQRRRARPAPPRALPAHRVWRPEENQARRLLDDLAGYRAWLEQQDGVALSDIVAGHRWVSEIYLPVVDAIPPSLAGRLAPPEVFHEILEHRWFLSEQAGGDVGTTDAAASYFAHVLPLTPKEITTPSAMAAGR